ncbi:undecaprenyl-diphosphate phosphatase [Salibacteraceae bacterium]|nr:UDP-diphosphatase [Crocinitomicaceae bacterium]MCH9823358.1 undecaprenyl-diphosphate phosphatase [Bacteroidota bacterium]MDB9725575.1 undecaprenyl-diphosphate phosphatase [Salibacteraceae bacterium]MDC1205194.1 undecaprenyl-diphosphate phosphatase [Salibacteraceae bacterium]
MSILEAIILGVIQGLTEFLPVSSSGHIELGKAVLNVELNDPLLFSIVVHAATALSTIVIFRMDIWMLIRMFFEPRLWNAGRQYILYIAISMIPAGLVGLFYKSEIENFFDGNILLVGFMLLVTAMLLFMTTKIKREKGKIGFASSLLIGVIQAVAILPGISRSGATISTALMLGVSRSRAARFSFLMVIPLILGATLLDVKDYIELQQAGLATADTVEPVALIAGFIAAFVSGLFACNWMIQLVKKSKLQYFALYCLVAGIVAIAFSI